MKYFLQFFIANFFPDTSEWIWCFCVNDSNKHPYFTLTFILFSILLVQIIFPESSKEKFSICFLIFCWKCSCGHLILNINNMIAQILHSMSVQKIYLSYFLYDLNQDDQVEATLILWFIYYTVFRIHKYCIHFLYEWAVAMKLCMSVALHNIFQKISK